MADHKITVHSEDGIFPRVQPEQSACGQQGAGQQQDGQQTGEESEFLHEGFSLMICRTMPVRQAHGSMCRGERQGKGRPETRRRRGSG